MLIVILFGLHCLHRGCHFAARRILRLCCEAGRWSLELEAVGSREPEEIVEIHPQADSVVLPGLVVFRIRDQAAARSGTLVLAADAFPAECWRRLQLNLRQTLSAGTG